MPPDTETPLPIDRRRYRRYEVALDLHYTLRSGRTGSGRIANMSSGGILFQSHQLLPVGELIEADVAWPLLLNQTRRLTIRVRGMVVRSGAAGTAITISRYEFHTHQ